MHKLVVIPNMQIGNVVINYYCEAYSKDTVCTYQGIRACNGWHEYPCYAERWEKRPYDSFYASKKDLEAIMELYDAVEFIE